MSRAEDNLIKRIQEEVEATFHHALVRILGARSLLKKKKKIPRQKISKSLAFPLIVSLLKPLKSL